MTTLKKARDEGKLDQFAKEHDADPPGDLDAFEVVPEIWTGC